MKKNPDSHFNKSYDIIEPQASIMIESLRSFGYSVQTAIADLVDNSISAKAKNIWLDFIWNGKDSHISIRDDGSGMTETQLVNAMRLGSQNPLQERESNDLGRFGLGLKTASFSQCRRLTVASLAENNSIVIRRWDLDHVAQVNEWQVLHSPSKDSEDKLFSLRSMSHGTIVLWENLDSIVGLASRDNQKAQDNFLEIIENVEHHLAIIFHRFLEKRNRLKIWINSRQIEPWDPFLSKCSSTQLLPKENLLFKEEKITIQPYVLPHHSKLDSQIYAKAEGLKGWNNQQGFYVYRNERLLVAGDWLGLGYRKDEYCKLARIQIDLPNSIDLDWSIDIKKSRAKPPISLRHDLKRIARLTRSKATEVYRHRGKRIIQEHAEKYMSPWNKKLRREKVFYSIDRDHPLVKEVLSLPVNYQPLICALLRLLEETIPIQLMWTDNLAEHHRHAHPFEEAPTEELIELVKQIYSALRKSGMTHLEACEQISKTEFLKDSSQLLNALPNSFFGEII